MLIGVSTRKNGRLLEKVPVSRRFVTATTAELDGWLRRDLSEVSP